MLSNRNHFFLFSKQNWHIPGETCVPFSVKADLFFAKIESNAEKS